MNIFENYRHTKDEKKNLETIENANDLFQVREHESELWLTFNGSLVCPFGMMKDDPVTAIGKMRELYIKRNSV